MIDCFWAHLGPIAKKDDKRMVPMGRWKGYAGPKRGSPWKIESLLLKLIQRQAVPFRQAWNIVAKASIEPASALQMATRATFFSGELVFSGQNCRQPKLNQNTRSIHRWKAGMMYIIPVSLNSTLDLYIERNQRWKFCDVHENLMDFKN